MLELKKIAVTGCLSSGKTLACKMLSEFGACVVSTDELAHQLLVSDSKCIHDIELLFGSEVKVNHQIDRKKLARLAFADTKKLGLLENILHPLIFKKMETLYIEACKLHQYKMFVAEVPLLFEAGWEFFFDAVITVVADELLCRKRSLDKGLTHTDYALRSKKLLSSDEKMRHADYIVRNNTTEEDLKKQVMEIVKKIETIS